MAAYLSLTTALLFRDADAQLSSAAAEAAALDARLRDSGGLYGPMPRRAAPVTRRRYHARWRRLNRARMRAATKRWADKNRESVRRKNRAYRAAHREAHIAYMREWRRRNKARTLRRVAR